MTFNGLAYGLAALTGWCGAAYYAAFGPLYAGALFVFVGVWFSWLFWTEDD